jgi:formylglycine-generating enzyme required for sulfatase activity
MTDYNPNNPLRAIKDDSAQLDPKDYEIYESGLTKSINEITLKPIDDDIRNIKLAFVPLLCDIFIESYEIQNRHIINIKFSGKTNIPLDISKTAEEGIINKFESLINQGKDDLYTDPSNRPIILSLPFNDGKKKAKWHLDIISAATLLSKFILIGKPGSGKTISTRFIALELLKSKGLPIYIELKDFFEKNEEINRDIISSYVNKKYGTIDFGSVINSFHKKGKQIIYILDGIDEIYSSSVKKLDERINIFIKDEKNVILTCREGYSDIKKFSLLPIVSFEALQDEQIEELFIKYSNADLNEFRSYIKHIPLELKNRPLFIVLLISLFEKDKEYPRDKVSLYEDCLNLLIFEWKKDSKKIDAKVYHYIIKVKDNFKFALEEIAFKSLLNGSITTKEIQYIFLDFGITNHQEGIISYLHSITGLLIKEKEEYEFAHRSFCEYLTAKRISRRLDPVEIDKLLETKTYLFREAFLYLGDILINNNKLAELRDLIAILSESEAKNGFNWTLWLASQLYNPKVFDKAAKIYKEGLKGAIKNHLVWKNFMPAKEQAEIVKTLGKIGDDREGISIKNNLPDIKWCLIAEGGFNYGISDLNKQILIKLGILNIERDLPSEEIILPKFYMSKYPITIEQYRAFIKDCGYTDERWWNINNDSKEWFENNKGCFLESHDKHIGTPDNYPANYICWFEAIAYCKWLSYKTNEFINLPTEEQWEKAVKQNGNTIFPWGNQFDEKLLNSNRSFINDVCAVGCFNENENGPLDMCGNIWEWCLSKIVDEDNPAHYKIITRGGSFINEPYKIIRSTFRGRDLPQTMFKRQGFRIVKNDEVVFPGSPLHDNEIQIDAYPQNKENSKYLLPEKVKLVSAKNNKGRKIEQGNMVCLKYSIAYSLEELNKEKYIQFKDKFEFVMDMNTLNFYVYSVLMHMSETSTRVVSINARDFCGDFNFNKLIDLNKKLFFEFHIISIA